MGNLRMPFTGAIEGYAKNLISKNMWRVKDAATMDDLMSDAYRIYLQCVDRYGSIVDNRAWFMSIYKTSLINHIHAISKYSTRLDNMVNLPDLAVHIEDYLGSEYGYGELLVKIAQAPDEVKRVIDYLLDTSYEKELMDDAWRKLGGKKVESGNEYLCRVFGYNPARKDLIAMVYDYFLDKED